MTDPKSQRDAFMTRTQLSRLPGQADSLALHILRLCFGFSCSCGSTWDTSPRTDLVLLLTSLLELLEHACHGAFRAGSQR